MTTELDAAPILIVQTPADSLYAQLCAGRLTPDEYHAALAFVAPPQEETRACVYCGASAYIGQTCAAHADRASVAATAHAYRNARPVVNLAIYSTRLTLTAAVIAALERAELYRAARRFASRAAEARGMNALAQIARDYVRLIAEVAP